MKTQSNETELALINAIFEHGMDAFQVCRKEDIKETDFVIPASRLIYRAIQEYYENHRIVPDLNNFEIYLRSRPDVNQEIITSFSAYSSDMQTKKIPKEAVEEKCFTLKDYTALREVAKAFNQETSDFSAGKTKMVEVCSRLERTVQNEKCRILKAKSQDSIGLKTGFDRRVEHVKKQLEYEQNKADPSKISQIKIGAKYGFKNFDNFLNPIEFGSLVVFQAKTSMGKSFFLMNTALENYLAGLNVLVVTIEMQALEIALRMDTRITGFDSNQFKKGFIASDQVGIDVWKAKLEGFSSGNPDQDDLIVHWVPENCTISTIEAIVMANKKKIDVLIVDYAGDMSAGLRGISDLDFKAQQEIYRSLKRFAGANNLVLFTAQQTKRGVQDLTVETGSLSYGGSTLADIMISIDKTKDDELIGVADGAFEVKADDSEDIKEYKLAHRTITLLKNRNNPKYKTFGTPVFNRMRFEELLAESPIPDVLSFNDLMKRTDMSMTDEEREDFRKKREIDQLMKNQEILKKNADDIERLKMVNSDDIKIDETELEEPKPRKSLVEEEHIDLSDVA